MLQIRPYLVTGQLKRIQGSFRVKDLYNSYTNPENEEKQCFFFFFKKSPYFEFLDKEPLIR